MSDGSAFVRVGTVEERSTAIGIFGIKPALKAWPNQFLTGKALSIEPDKRHVVCQDALGGTYELSYDVLAIATGAQVRYFRAWIHLTANFYQLLHVSTCECRAARSGPLVLRSTAYFFGMFRTPPTSGMLSFATGSLQEARVSPCT